MTQPANRDTDTDEPDERTLQEFRTTVEQAVEITSQSFDIYQAASGGGSDSLPTHTHIAAEAQFLRALWQTDWPPISDDQPAVGESTTD